MTVPFIATRHLLSIATSAVVYVAISDYRRGMYDRAFADWRRIEINRPNDSGQVKRNQRRMAVNSVGRTEPAVAFIAAISGFRNADAEMIWVRAAKRSSAGRLNLAGAD